MNVTRRHGQVVLPDVGVQVSSLNPRKGRQRASCFQPRFPVVVLIFRLIYPVDCYS